MAENKCKHCGEPVEPQIIISSTPGPKGEKGEKGDTPDMSPYAKKTDIPTSLPANGGNADTVDNKHAADFIPATAKGAVGGVAQLDSTGKVPAAQLPSYVDDVLEYAGLSAFPVPGETGKIYVATDTNLTYRWSGTGYVNLSSPIALGETSSTAYAGDKGKQNATDIAGIRSGTVKAGKAILADMAAQASNAAQAVSDGEGRNIKATYAEKAAIPTKLPADGGNADTVDGVHAAAAGTVEAGKLASYDASGRLKGEVVEAAKYLKTGQGAGTGLALGYDIGVYNAKRPLYGIVMGKPSEFDVQPYGDVADQAATVFIQSADDNAVSMQRGWIFYSGIADRYAASISVRGNAKFAGEVTATAFRGNADSATQATRAVNDENGNNIPKTYATKGEVTNVQVGGRNYVTGLKDNWEGGLVGSDGTITTGNNYNQVTKDYQDISFLAGKSATVSVNPNVILSGTDRLKLSFRIAFYTQDFLFISYESSDYNATQKTLTVPDNAYYCKASVGLGIYGYVANNFDTVHFQLEFGNKATDYGLAPQDIARINGEYPDMKVGKATADGDGNKIPDTYATQKGTYPSLTVGKATKADQDKNGNDIPATYYKKAGDVMTGTMKQKKGDCTILNDVASMRIPWEHKGWIALDFGLDAISVMGEIHLYKYGWGGIVIDFSGYTYVGTGGANNWHVPRYGVRGSIGAMPEVAFAKDNATGKRYILIGGDNFTWGQYDYIALPRVILGSIGNDARDRTWAFTALTGTLVELGITAVSTGGPSFCIEVDKARKAVADGNGLNIPNNYARKTYVRPGNSWDSVGWYRVYTSGVTNNPGENIDLNIITYYNYDRTQNISLRVCVGYGLVSVVQQNAFFNTPISKIRVVWKGNSTFYIDAYMKDSRGVWVCLNQTGGTGTLAETAILNPAFVDGYTTTEFDIRAGDRPMQLSEKPGVYLSRPAAPKNGDIVISVTD